MKVTDFNKLATRYIHLLIDLKPRNIRKLVKFYASFKKYQHLSNGDKLSIHDFYPYLQDNTATTTFDAHYFYQGFWAFGKIKESLIKSHVDVGSQISWVGLLSAITRVTFIDLRPFTTNLKNLTVLPGDLLNLPLADHSVRSLSCLHVAEHIGLGRYGDKLDPEGTKKACRELLRVLAPKGNLFFSVPVGKPKTVFNAHRIHSPQSILSYFPNMELQELSGITDRGEFIENIDIRILSESDYACGLFWFRKKSP